MTWRKVKSISTDRLTGDTLGFGRLGQPGTWRAAYRLATGNAAVFLSLAAIMFFAKPTSLAVILFVPALFFFGSALAFLRMVRSGGELAAVSWFVFGAGIFFGMGAVAGGLHVHPHSNYLYADDTLYLLRVNLLNAISVCVVLLAAYPLANMRASRTVTHDWLAGGVEQVLLKIFPWVVAVAALGVGLKYAFFPVAEDLAIRSIAAKIYLIIPACFLLLGLLWRSCGWTLRLMAGGVLVFEVINGLVGFTKYQVISAILALMVGLWFTRRSIGFVLATLAILAGVFVAINPLVTLGRAHIDYDAEKNSVATRFAILVDAANAYYLDDESVKASGPEVRPNSFTLDPKPMTSSGERLKALGRRFDVASIQGYLINEYDHGRPGNSLKDFWVVFVPRALWPDKPIVTRHGGELNAKYYYYPGQARSQTDTSIAPTYSGEAYWNYGPFGVVFISLLLGLAIGWLTQCWQQAKAGRDPAFLLIAYPVAIWACFVESWLVATCLGEFVIFALILFAARVFFRC